MDTKNVTVMYDTVNFIVFRDDYPDIDFLSILPQLLTSITSEGESNQGKFVIGYLKTYRVSINRYRVSIKDSSLAKFINNDNQQGMSLQQTRNALELMSDLLHISMDNAKITRIDVGNNIITRHSPEVYFPYLGSKNAYKRVEMGDGLGYKNSQKFLVFYNKIKEQKKRRIDIQPVFNGHYLLRYELRLMNHLERLLNQPRVIGRLLFNEDFYINLCKLWRDEYLSISKLSNPTGAIQPTTSTRELTANLASLAIRQIGDDSLIRMIAQWSEQGHLSKKQASDHRKAIREAVKYEMKNSGNEFIDELDRKVKQSVRFYV